jgi:phosphopantothenoylcysteine synthetase/decarboxylase
LSDGKVVYLIAAAAPPVLEIEKLVLLLQECGWQVCVILTPTAATWVDVPRLERVTGSSVRVNPRLPREQDPLPAASAVLGAPLTFNVINKWALGINDTLALGLLNELLGTRVPIVAVPCAKVALRNHPAYEASVSTLVGAGVRMLDPDQFISRPVDGLVTFDWRSLVEWMRDS